MIHLSSPRGRLAGGSGKEQAAEGGSDTLSVVVGRVGVSVQGGRRRGIGVVTAYGKVSAEFLVDAPAST
jgi:hypothetical protein